MAGSTRVESPDALLTPATTFVVDGLVDNGYQFAGRVENPVPGTDALGPGNLFQAESGGLCYYAFVVDRTYNDNVYDASANTPYLALDGWTAHKFDQLKTSDRADFSFKNPTTGVTIGYVSMDYLYPCGTSWCAGPMGNDVNNSLSPKLPVAAASSSMVYNILKVNWPQKSPGGNLSDGRSPDYNFNDTNTPKYEWHMIYELSINANYFWAGWGLC